MPLIVLALVFLLAPFFALYSGFWGHFLWVWFMVPIGAPALTITQLAGAFLFIGYLKTGLSSGSKGWQQGLATGLLVPPMFVGICWLFKLFFL